MSWMMIAYYSMCPSNEWLPSEQLSVKTDWGMPEGEGGGGWGVTLCARSEFWFSFFFFLTPVFLCSCSWTMQSPGWPSWRAVTARGPAAPTVWSTGIRSCGWSPRTAGTVHVKWVSPSYSKIIELRISVSRYWKKKKKCLSNRVLFIREVSLSTSKWKKTPLQGDSLSLFSTISFMLRNLLEKCLSISRGKTTEVCIISKTLSVKLLTAHYKLQTRANNTHYFMNLWSLGVYICKTVEGSDFKICDVITM